MSQQYSLRWNNHQPNFISMFTSLLNTQTLVDVTLAAEGQQLQAHKVVLSACSTYFQALFVDNPSRHPIVILKDVTFADLRTMVDFMYYGEVNVTEQQLPKVLDTAKHLKIKGLTEMPDTASLRAQGTSADFQSPVDSADSQRHSVSPSSPVTKRKRRRKSSTGSTSLNMVIGEENKEEKGSQTLDLVRGESITLSSVPQQRRVREYHDERTLDHMQQTNDPHNLNVDPMSIDPDAAGMPQGGQWSVMEHTYPRYSNACLGGGIQTDPGMYMNNVINPHMDNEIDYSQSLGVAGPSPGPSCVTEQQATQEMPVMPQKRRRTTNPQSEENFQRALEAVRFGGHDNVTYVRENSLNCGIRRSKKIPILMGKEQSSFTSAVEASTDLTTEDVKLRRSKLLKRQTRVIPEERIEVRKQVSEPTPQCAAPMLQKHESYPEYESKQLRRVRLTRIDRDVPSIFIQDTSLISTPEPSTTQRASHTPAVRAGPPLSCNFCWNTVDDTGRILRRKTQYHCPECRTNLCIVPCFHEYHEGPESEANASAK